MSRGPGIWQRQILDLLDDGVDQVVLTSQSLSHAEQNAIRRAAYTLEAKGQIRIVAEKIYGVPRLVAMLPGAELPSGVPVTGLDGKTYRRPAAGT